MGGVYRVNGDLAVSRGFGDAEYKKTGGPGPEDRPVTADPEMGHFECAASDFLLIVCDGVSEGNFSNAEVCEHAAKVLKETGGDAAKAAEAVVFRALEAESKDNISCMIVLLGGENRPREFQKEFHPGCLIGADDANFRKAGTLPLTLPLTLTLTRTPNPAPAPAPGPNPAPTLQAYTAMCARGGVRFGEAVEVRHASLIRKPSGARTATDVAELELIGSPPGAEGSAQREAWFEGWADMVAQRSGSMDDDDDDDDDGGIAVGGRGAPGGPPGSQQEVMRMLMGMMQQQQMQQQQRQQQQAMQHMQMQRGTGGRAGAGRSDPLPTRALTPTRTPALNHPNPNPSPKPNPDPTPDPNPNPNPNPAPNPNRDPNPNPDPDPNPDPNPSPSPSPSPAPDPSPSLLP